MRKGSRKHIGISKQCLQCFSIIRREERRKHSPKQWEELKYCGGTCAGLARVGISNPWALGDNNSSKRPDVREKISKSLTGVRLSPLHKAALSRGWLKRKARGLGFHSEQTREKMRGSAHHGESNTNWRGGITPLYLQIRHVWRAKQWREAVFKRDDWTCRMCPTPVRGGKLHADHIKPFAAIVSDNKITSLEGAMKCKELWDINNGRALCVLCHRKTETFGGRTKIINSPTLL